jgi:hypothetical protein
MKNSSLGLSNVGEDLAALFSWSPMQVDKHVQARSWQELPAAPAELLQWSPYHNSEVEHDYGIVTLLDYLNPLHHKRRTIKEVGLVLQ